MTLTMLETPQTAPAEAEFAPPTNRMVIAALSLIGLFIAGYLLMHKLGLIGTLTCGVGDCGTVQASRYAVFLGVPVPVWGVLGYAMLLVAALAGLQPRWGGRPRMAGAIFALALVAFCFSLYLTALEAFVIRAWCQWCVVSAVLATFIFLAALPELRRITSAEAR